MYHVDGVAVAVVAIGDDGDRNAFSHFARAAQVVIHRQNVGVGDAAGRRDFKAAGPDALKGGFFSELGRKAVMGADNRYRTFFIE